MSSGAVLTVVAAALAIVIALLFRLVGVLDSAELSLRRLAADVRAARKTMGEAGDLAAAVERDAGRSQAALNRLEQLKRGDRSGEAAGPGTRSAPPPGGRPRS